MTGTPRQRYYLTEGDSPEREVTKAEFVRAERDAGFVNTMREPGEPATTSFSGQDGDSEIRGRTEYVSPGEPVTPAQFAPEGDADAT